MYSVDLTSVRKVLRGLPFYIRDKVQIWADQVEKEGLYKVQVQPGYKDHALKGQRKGQRSVYLNRSWRLIYSVGKSTEVVLVKVQ